MSAWRRKWVSRLIPCISCVCLCVSLHAEGCVALTEAAFSVACLYMWRNMGACWAEYACEWSVSLSLPPFPSLSVSLSPPPHLSLCVHVCMYVSRQLCWGVRKREREGVQYEWGRAVLACGRRAGCYRLVAVLRWWPWSEPPSRKWWSSYTGSRGWPSPRHATRNSARYVSGREWAGRESFSCLILL